jgi:hypothetical protein
VDIAQTWFENAIVPKNNRKTNIFRWKKR